MKKIIEAKLYESEFLEAKSRVEFDIIFKDGENVKEVGSYIVYAYGNIYYHITDDKNFQSQTAKLIAMKLRKITGKRMDDKEMLAHVDYKDYEQKDVVNRKYWDNALEEHKKADVILDKVIIEDQIEYKSDEELGIIPQYIKK